MMHFKLLSQGFNGFVNEVCTLITHKDLWASKSSYDIIKYELHGCSCTRVFNYSVFYPFGQILRSNDNVSGSYTFPWWIDVSPKSIACLSKACKGNYGVKGISSLMDGFPTL